MFWPLAHSLYGFAPDRRVAQGHEDTVGEDGQHDEQAEERGSVTETLKREYVQKPSVDENYTRQYKTYDK